MLTCKRGPFHELLIAEYHHVAESLLRNEEDGEKRVTFLITLAGGVAAAIGVVLGKHEVAGPQQDNPLPVIPLVALFSLGYLTLVRFVTRNLATDRYKRGLDRIQRYFLESERDPRTHSLAFNPYGESTRRLLAWNSAGKGGWLPTVVLVDSILLGAIAMVLTASGSWWVNAAVGIVIGALSWIVPVRLPVGDTCSMQERSPTRAYIRTTFERGEARLRSSSDAATRALTDS